MQRTRGHPQIAGSAITVPIAEARRAGDAMRRTMLLGLLGAAAALHPQLRAAARPRQQRHAPWSVRMDEGGRGAKIAKLEATLEELDAAGIEQAAAHARTCTQRARAACASCAHLPHTRASRR